MPDSPRLDAEGVLRATVQCNGNPIADSVQLVRADVFYGSIEFEDASFVTRERAPYRHSIDLGDLSKNRSKLPVYPCRVHDGDVWIAVQ